MHNFYSNNNKKSGQARFFIASAAMLYVYIMVRIPMDFSSRISRRTGAT